MKLAEALANAGEEGADWVVNYRQRDAPSAAVTAVPSAFTIVGTEVSARPSSTTCWRFGGPQSYLLPSAFLFFFFHT